MTFFGLTSTVMDDDFITENVLVSAVCGPKNNFEWLKKEKTRKEYKLST